MCYALPHKHSDDNIFSRQNLEHMRWTWHTIIRMGTQLNKSLARNLFDDASFNIPKKTTVAPCNDGEFRSTTHICPAYVAVSFGKLQYYHKRSFYDVSMEFKDFESTILLHIEETYYLIDLSSMSFSLRIVIVYFFHILE